MLYFIYLTHYTRSVYRALVGLALLEAAAKVATRFKRFKMCNVLLFYSILCYAICYLLLPPRYNLIVAHLVAASLNAIPTRVQY